MSLTRAYGDVFSMNPYVKKIVFGYSDFVYQENWLSQHSWQTCMKPWTVPLLSYYCTLEEICRQNYCIWVVDSDGVCGFSFGEPLKRQKTFDTPPMRFFLVCNKSEWVIPPKWTLFRLCHVKNWLRNRNSYCSFFKLYSKSCNSIDRHEHPSSLRKQKGISQVPKHYEIGPRKLNTALTQLRCLLLF